MGIQLIQHQTYQEHQATSAVLVPTQRTPCECEQQLPPLLRFQLLTNCRIWQIQGTVNVHRICVQGPRKDDMVHKELNNESAAVRLTPLCA